VVNCLNHLIDDVCIGLLDSGMYLILKLATVITVLVSWRVLSLLWHLKWLVHRVWMIPDLAKELI